MALCQIIYKVLDYSSKTSLEFMGQRDFTRKMEKETQEFLKKLSEDNVVGEFQRQAFTIESRI